MRGVLQVSLSHRCGMFLKAVKACHGRILQLPYRRRPFSCALPGAGA
jgi:hypothetical protein